MWIVGIIIFCLLLLLIVGTLSPEVESVNIKLLLKQREEVKHLISWLSRIDKNITCEELYRLLQKDLEEIEKTINQVSR
jgi:hypothetical protein